MHAWDEQAHHAAARRLAKAVAAVAVLAAFVVAPVGPVRAWTHPPAPAASPAVTTMTADYATRAGVLDKSALLGASQGGYGVTRGNLRWFGSYASQLATLGVRRVRLDHVFDDNPYSDVSRDASGGLQFDFSRLDEVVLPLLRNGIEPFMSLSYTPCALGPCTPTPFAPPTDLTGWSQAVTALVSHYVQLGYRGWNWEVWNEPDGGQFWTGTEAQYNQLYQVSAAAVTAADPTASVGGPAVCCGATDGFMLGFLDYVAAHPGLPVDFLSWHPYGATDFSETVSEVRQAEAARGIPAKKLYATEYNSTAALGIGAGAMADTNEEAAYLAHVLSTAVDQPDLAGVFYFTPVEGLTQTSTFDGDLGLMTSNDHVKAAGNTFAMFNALAPTRLRTQISGPEAASGLVSGLASTDRSTGVVTELAWNDTASPQDLSLGAANLPYAGTRFAVTQTLIDATHSNYFTDWSNGITDEHPGPHEDLQPVAETVHAPARSWSTQTTLPPYSVTEFTLSPTAGPTGPVAVHSDPSVTDYAQNRAVTASSSLEDPGQGWGTAELVDRQDNSLPIVDAPPPTMGWSSDPHPTDAATEWVQVDLGAARTIDTAVLWPRNDKTADGHGFPRSFTIAAATTSTGPWTTLAQESDYHAGAAVTGPQTFSFPPNSYRYLRVTASRLGQPIVENGVDTYRFQLAELDAERLGVPNPGFETGSLSPWIADGPAQVSTGHARTGAAALQLSGRSGVHVTVHGLQPDTAYTFGGYLKSAQPDQQVSVAATSNSTTTRSTAYGQPWYLPVSVAFRTGADGTATVSINTGSGGTAWADDFTIQPSG